VSNASSTPTAQALFDQIRHDLAPLMERIVTHRYLDMLERKEVPREALKPLATQQYLIVSNAIRNMALLVSRFAHLPSKKKLNEFLQAEFVVQDAVLAFAEAVGLSEEALRQAQVLPDAMAFSYYQTFLCLYGCDADLITAFFFDAQVWIKNALRVGQALRNSYGLSKEAVRFFEMYVNYEAAEDEVIPLVQAALDRGIPAHQIYEATRLLLEYELRYWDAMAAASAE
jgi:thiaminase